MLNAPLALELAKSAIQERIRQAQREALILQLPAAQRAPLARVARRRFAGALRDLAVWLDPTLA
jgi:hypothetical protein